MKNKMFCSTIIAIITMIILCSCKSSTNKPVESSTKASATSSVSSNQSSSKKNNINISSVKQKNENKLTTNESNNRNEGISDEDEDNSEEDNLITEDEDNSEEDNLITEEEDNTEEDISISDDEQTEDFTSFPEEAESTTSYDELSDVALFNKRYNNLWNFMIQIEEEKLLNLENQYAEYSNYIKNNSTIDQTTYYVLKRQTDEQYANLGLTNSGPHKIAIESLRQKYLIENNQTVIKYKAELPELAEEIEATKELLDKKEGLQDFVISKLCEEYGYDETAAYNMLY